MALRSSPCGAQRRRREGVADSTELARSHTSRGGYAFELGADAVVAMA